MKSKRIPIKVCKQISKNYEMSQVILLTYDKTNNRTHIVTYGSSIQDCKEAADGGNKLKKVLGWPDELCNAVPKRVSNKKILMDNGGSLPTTDDPNVLNIDQFKKDNDYKREVIEKIDRHNDVWENFVNGFDNRLLKKAGLILKKEKNKKVKNKVDLSDLAFSASGQVIGIKEKKKKEEKVKKNKTSNKKKEITIDDFEIVNDKQDYPDYISWDNIEKVLGKEKYKDFCKFMNGQTCCDLGCWSCDVENFLRKPQNRFFD